MNKKSYMTLKEASEKSGYSADYIGQLIRNGKLPGKQIYSGVAWVTTEAALDEYLKSSRGNKRSRFEKLLNYVRSEKKGNRAELFLRTLLYIGITIVIPVVFVLFYLFSIKVERFLETRSLHQIESLRTQ